jgi:Salmonella virulence plasmid 65kDa B protein
VRLGDLAAVGWWHGLQPQLALAYSTGNGNGVVGLGWALSLPGVARKTSWGLPSYYDSAARR